MGVRVSFLGRGPAGAAAAGVLVPAEAVRADGERGVVFVVRDGDTVERRAVTLGRGAGPERRVLTGLAAGERVVVAPPAGLEDGDAVRPAAGP
jgi:hypothetical protein